MKRIIFVDDEPNILQGLKRMLRSMRNEWDMHFAEGADAALELLASQPFDVVVTDMRMPQLDGAHLLSQVRERYPSTARIILSGHAEQEMAIRSVASAHQFLAKPCDAETLRATVLRTCQLRDMMASERLQRLTAEINQLPSVPEIYQRLNVEMGKDEPSMQQISAIIGDDLAMSAKLLQLVNSAFFGLRRHIGSIDQAVAYLGMDVIRSLVLSESAFKCFESGDCTLSAESLIRHGRAVGTLAKSIARQCSDNKVLADETFQAGMMHELGKLILAAELGEEYQRVIDAVAAGGSQSENERLVFGITHGEVGAYLLGLWGLADGIVEAIAYHREPAATQVEGFAPIVALHVATALLAEKGEGVPQTLDEGWLTQMGFGDRIGHWREMAAAQHNEKDAA